MNYYLIEKKNTKKLYSDKRLRIFYQQVLSLHIVFQTFYEGSVSPHKAGFPGQGSSGCLLQVSQSWVRSFEVENSLRLCKLSSIRSMVNAWV